MRPRLFGNIFLIESKRQMSYRADFWVAMVGGLLAGVVLPYFMWGAIYDNRTTATLGGFTFAEILTYYIAVTLIAKAVRGADLVIDASNDIYEGGLNRYLLYPTGYLPFKYAQHLGLLVPSALQLVIFAGIFLLVLDVPETVPVTLRTSAMALGAAVLGNVLYFLFTFPIQLVAFWADNVWSLLVLQRMVGSLLGGLLLPLSLFPERAQEFLKYTPFPCFYAVPVQAFMGRLTWEEWSFHMITATVWCIVLVMVTRWLWHRGTLQYTGVGI